MPEGCLLGADTLGREDRSSSTKKTSEENAIKASDEVADGRQTWKSSSVVRTSGSRAIYQHAEGNGY